MRDVLTAMAVCAWLASVTSNAATFYVAVTGADTNDGASPATAWKTVTYAATRAKAGDAVYIRAGLYRGEKVNIANSGTEEQPFTFTGWDTRAISNPGGTKAPIIFQGYTTTPGDTPDVTYKPGDRPNPEELPVLDGETGTNTAISAAEKSCIEVRHLGITNYLYGIFPQVSSRIVVEHVLVVGIGPDGGGQGIWVRDCDNCTIRNCVVTDSGMCNILVERTHDSIVENCRTYAVTTDPGPATTDYHIVVKDAPGNTVRDCQAYNMHWQNTNAHTGHGIGIKDTSGSKDYPYPHTERSTIINCAAYNMGEYLFLAHGAFNNEFINCTAIGQFRSQAYWSEGINIRDGAHDNVFRNCRIEGARTSVAIQDTSEGPNGPDGLPLVQICSKNTIVNCVFADSAKGIELWNADDNLFKNCVFDGVGEWALVRFPMARKCQGNVCRNTIVTNVRGGCQQADKGTGDEIVFSYSCFWKNSFAMPAGVGNLSRDPLFVDAAKRNYRLATNYGRWDATASTWVKDSETSPCFDAGDPADDFSTEPEPSGGRIDIGAYGGTPEAWRKAGAAPGGTKPNASRTAPPPRTAAAPKDADPELTAALADGLRAAVIAVIAGVAAGRHETVFLDSGAGVTRATVVGADASGLLVKMNGMETRVPWASLTPLRFYGIARRYCTDREVLEAFRISAGISGNSQSL